MSRVLGLDVGDKRIGVALSDEGRLIASPLTVIQSVGWGPDSREILRLMEEHGAELIVCGLPRNMDGSVGFQAEKVQRFMQVLTDQGVPVAWMDERLTTVSAQRALIEGGVRREDRKKSVDKVAAAVILQAWLDNAQNVKEYNEMANDEIRRPDEEPETDEVPDVVELTDEAGRRTVYRPDAHRGRRERRRRERLCGLHEDRAGRERRGLLCVHRRRRPGGRAVRKTDPDAGRGRMNPGGIGRG